MKLLTQNSKLKKTSIENNARVLNFSLPAYKTITGKTVCPFAKDCIKYCYAQKGNYRYPSVVKGLNNRYNLSQTIEPQMGFEAHNIQNRVNIQAIVQHLSNTLHALDIIVCF